MKRRQLIQGLLGAGTTAMIANWPGYALYSTRPEKAPEVRRSMLGSSALPDLSELDPLSDNERPSQLMAASQKSSTRGEVVVTNIDTRDADTMPTSTKSATVEVTNKLNTVDKVVDFARNYSDDVLVGETDVSLLVSTFNRLKNLQQTIGYGHFNLVSFDEAITFAKRFSAVGEFSKGELEFVERVFFTNAADYGFYGQKVTNQLTSEFKKSELVKVAGSGHYIFKNDSLAYYKKLKSDVGNSIILTSGIRSNVKQLYLFLAKTLRVKGNLSRASRSLAPPGYSYHGIGDFDVGRVGWGGKNFTDDFADTDEYKKMLDLGYIAIRYDHGNKLGVRFEPWHIKVV